MIVYFLKGPDYTFRFERCETFGLFLDLCLYSGLLFFSQCFQVNGTQLVRCCEDVCCPHLAEYLKLYAILTNTCSKNVIFLQVMTVIILTFNYRINKVFAFLLKLSAHAETGLMCDNLRLFNFHPITSLSF